MGEGAGLRLGPSSCRRTGQACRPSHLRHMVSPLPASPPAPHPLPPMGRFHWALGHIHPPPPPHTHPALPPPSPAPSLLTCPVRRRHGRRQEVHVEQRLGPQPLQVAEQARVQPAGLGVLEPLQDRALGGGGGWELGVGGRKGGCKDVWKSGTGCSEDWGGAGVVRCRAGEIKCTGPKCPYMRRRKPCGPQVLHACPPVPSPCPPPPCPRAPSLPPAGTAARRRRRTACRPRPAS